MGLLDIFRPKNHGDAQKAHTAQSFQSITEYSPTFTSWDGTLYEKALTRACVERTAVLASKLKPEVVGSDTCKPRVRRLFQTAPNRYMSWPDLIRRAVTVLLTDNTVAIVPALDAALNVTGLFPLKFEYAEVIEMGGQPWFRFHLGSGGDPLVIEADRCALLTRYQYESDFFGGTNRALDATLGLIDYQEQAQREAIQNGAKIQFIAAASSTMRREDMEAKREQFSEANLSSKNKTGLMLYDSTFDSMKQVEPMNYTVDTDEMERIESNVFYYFSINKSILTSDYTEEQLDAFYEAVIEPIAVQMGERLTQMLFTERERQAGNQVMFSANRLEYASNASKRNMVRDMIDRGVMSTNEAREILQLPPLENDYFYVRGEYKNAEGQAIAPGSATTENPSGLKKQGNQGVQSTDFDRDAGGDDAIYNDTDGRGAKEEDE